MTVFLRKGKLNCCQSVKILCWVFSDLSQPSTWSKSKTAHFYFKPLFNALNMLSALWLAYLTCWTMRDWMHGKRSLDDVNKKQQQHTHIFLNKITYPSYCGWWASSCLSILIKNPFVHCLMRCLFAVSSWFVQRASLTVYINPSDVTSTVPYGRGIWEKESIIGVQWFQKNPNPRVHRSVGNSTSLVSHWNGGPSGWDFSVPTEHQWWILFFSHTDAYEIEWSLCKLAVAKICPTSLPMWDKRN